MDNNLALFGITFDRNRTLAIDSGKLDEILSSNFDALKKVFIGDGSTSDSDSAFVFQPDNTQAGNYSLNITTAA